MHKLSFTKRSHSCNMPDPLITCSHLASYTWLMPISPLLPHLFVRPALSPDGIGAALDVHGVAGVVLPPPSPSVQGKALGLGKSPADRTEEIDGGCADEAHTHDGETRVHT